MTAKKLDSDGSQITIQWDNNKCRTPEYNILYGVLDSIENYSLSCVGDVDSDTNGIYNWTDVPSGNTATLTNSPPLAQDVLTADTTGTYITGSFLKGILTLTGDDTLENYEQVLKTIQFDNTEQVHPFAPLPQRVVRIVANYINVTNPHSSYSTIEIDGSNANAPIIDLDTGSEGQSYNAAWSSGSPVPITDSTNALITDLDSFDLMQVKIEIVNPQNEPYEVLAANVGGTGINVFYPLSPIPEQ